MSRSLSEQSPEKEIGLGHYRDDQLERRVMPLGGALTYQIKVHRDTVPSVVGDDSFVWVVPSWFDGCELVDIEAAYSVAGAGADTELALRLSAPCETGSDVLSSKVVIPDGECNDDRTAVVVPNTILHDGDHLHIDTDATSGGLGLNVAITALTEEAAGVTVTGLRGPPGGVTNWSGAWAGNSPPATGPWADSTGYTAGDIVENGGTFYRATVTHVSGTTTEPGVGVDWEDVWEVVTYAAGDAVSNGGTTYVSIVNHTATVDSEPGVGADWEDFWQLLVEGHDPFSGIVVMILGNGYRLDVGVKAAIPIPFDCEIVEATLLADAAGDVVVDLWQDTYGAYPPSDADSITAAAPLTLVAANKTTDTTLTGWNTTLVQGDVLMVVIESTANLNWLSVGLRVQRP